MTQRKTIHTNSKGETKTYLYCYDDYENLYKCPVCDFFYAKHTKTTHYKSKYHKLAVQLRNENPNISNINAAMCEYRYKHEISSSDEEKPQYIKKYKTLERYNRVVEHDRLRKDLTGKIPRLVNKIKNSENITINMKEKLKILLIKYPDNTLLKDVQYILLESDLDYINEQLLLNQEKEKSFLSNFVVPSNEITCC